MEEREGEIIEGLIHLDGGQTLTRYVTDCSYTELSGGRRWSRKENLTALRTSTPERSDFDIHSQEWNHNLTKDDIQGF